MIAAAKNKQTVAIDRCPMQALQVPAGSRYGVEGRCMKELVL